MQAHFLYTMPVSTLVIDQVAQVKILKPMALVGSGLEFGRMAENGFTECTRKDCTKLAIKGGLCKGHLHQEVARVTFLAE